MILLAHTLADEAGMPPWAIGLVAIITTLGTTACAVIAAWASIRTNRKIGHTNGAGPLADQLSSVRTAVGAPQTPAERRDSPACPLAPETAPQPPTSGPTSAPTDTLWGRGG